MLRPEPVLRPLREPVHDLPVSGGGPGAGRSQRGRGLTFHVIANISEADLPAKKGGGDNRGLFRFVGQPAITAAGNEVWVVFNAGGPMAATGAPVTGPGQVGAFIPLEVVPGTNNCTYGDIAIGP